MTMKPIRSKFPVLLNCIARLGLKNIPLSLYALLMVIVSISPHHASAEANNCANPPAALKSFNPEPTPRSSPDFPFFDIDDQERRITDYKGRGIVLNFWATWCAPCVKELPDLMQLKEAIKEDGIEVLFLAEDRTGVKKVLPFLKKQKLEAMEVLIDKRSKVARKSGVRGLPVTILIDPAGNERGRVTGIAEWSSPDVEDFLKRCIGPSPS